MNNGILFELKSVNRKFWFFPTDLIYNKVEEIEKNGTTLYNKIANYPELLSIMTADTNSSALNYKISDYKITGNSTKENTDSSVAVVNTMEWVRANCKLDLSLDIIKEIHKIITQNVMLEQGENFSGRFRNGRAYILAASGYEIRDEGVDFDKISSALQETFELIESCNQLPCFLKNIIMEFLVLMIHPFFDKNGKTAQALLYFNLLKHNIKFMEILPIDRYRKINRKEYFELHDKFVDRDRNRNRDMTYFIDFNLNAIQNALDMASKKIDLLLQIQFLKERNNLLEHEVKILYKNVLQKFKMLETESWSYPNSRNITYRICQIS